MADSLQTKRYKNYLVTNVLVNEERELRYWDSKKIEIVDLSKISEFMKSKTPSDLEKQGKSLYSFLQYLKNDDLPFTNDRIAEIKKSLLKKITVLKPFNAISYNMLLSKCKFSRKPELIGDVLNFFNESDYNNIYKILCLNDEMSCEIKDYFIKSGIKSIHYYYARSNDKYYELSSERVNTSKMFDLSLSWDYSELEKEISLMNDSLEKAYYYSLIYKKNCNICFNLLLKLESDFIKKDFISLTLQDKYQMSILQFNLIAMRLLNYQIDNKDRWYKLNKLLDSSSNQNSAFEYIKSMCGDNGEILNKLHSLLLNHEEYYTKKSTVTKYGGNVYGDLLKIQAIVYDYYYFYKKNYLMLDWFSNVSKMCVSYVKAILCTYYPDEYQYSRTNLGRTQVKKCTRQTLPRP